MVISFTDATLSNQPRGVSSYYDMLAENAFGNFRKLIEDVSLHPMMGIYLTWLGNQKEDAATGRVPDLNFAREITQLFTIGEWMLNLDGTYVLDSNGKPAVAYTGADLAGLAQVFTGFSWYAGPNTERPHEPPLLRQRRRTSSATGGRCRPTTSTRRTPRSIRSARRPSSA
jgi:uncharacterized protein (DUF1800 family)